MALSEQGAQHTIHKEPKSHYPLPNDSEEVRRLHTQHNALLALFRNDPIQAPLNVEPLKIVDVGCGVNADMTIYLAKKFPRAKVYGLDLSEVHLETTPSNVEFITGNIAEIVGKDPRLQRGSIDYVYSRFLVTGINDWPAHIASLSSLVAPNGWLEMHDTRSFCWRGADGRVISDDWKWLRFMQTPVEYSEDDLTSERYFTALFNDGGLSNIHTRSMKAPWDPVSLLESRPEAIPWAQYVTSGTFASAFLPVFEKFLPGESNYQSRSDLLEEFKRTMRQEEGKHLQFLAIVGQKNVE